MRTNNENSTLYFKFYILSSHHSTRRWSYNDSFHRKLNKLNTYTHLISLSLYDISCVIEHNKWTFSLIFSTLKTLTFLPHIQSHYDTKMVDPSLDSVYITGCGFPPVMHLSATSNTPIRISRMRLHYVKVNTQWSTMVGTSGKSIFYVVFKRPLLNVTV